MMEIIKDKLKKYGATNQFEEENAIKEIMQEIALYALWREDFFNVALFQGGTSLRILHRLPRFSEDLDFPADYQVRHQDLSSNFALKIHALLCRDF
jgi:predicted nucleotidyltransferase component of viral defense system